MKNSHVLSLVFLALLIFSACTKEDKKDNSWMDLFDGKTLDGWIVKIHHHDAGVNFGNTFRAEDGIMKVRYDGYGDTFEDQFGHIYYEKPFSDFHLSLEYQFTGDLYPGAPGYTLLNSGLMFHSQDPRSMPKEQNWPISVEMQFLAGLGDGNPRPTGNMCSPGTDIEYEGKMYDGHCLNSSSPTLAKDEWVKAELIVYHDSLIIHMINGDTVLQYSHPTMGGGVVQGFDSTLWQPGKPLKEGFIALQSEGQPIDFKNIRLRLLE